MRELKLIMRALKVQPSVSEKLGRDAYRAEVAEWQRLIVTQLLDALGAIVILDGFDELASAGRKELALAEIKDLSMSCRKARIVLTSRTAEFQYSVDRMDQFEIAPLDEQQLADFAHNWLSNDAKAKDFLAQVKVSPFHDTAMRPLTLAHLCAVYEKAGKVPNRPKTVYRKVVSLLLEEWDEQRSVRRTSVYEGFTLDRKFEFLAQLAYTLTTKFGATTFGKDIICQGYEAIHTEFGLPAEDVHVVIAEIEGHTGLFLRVGYDQFEFAHKSLQEYLAAEYIVGWPAMPRDIAVIARLPNELAITIAISSRPSEYLCEFVLDVLHRQQLGRQFYDVFVERLTLERPEFGSNADAALALIVLVSLWSCRGGKSDAKSSFAEVPFAVLDRFCNQFDDLLGTPGREGLQSFYENPVVVSAGFTEMRRTREHKTRRIPTRLFLPDRLMRTLRGGVAN